MNREIKFQFWDEDTKTMYDWSWAQGRTMTIFTWLTKRQFTGLLDSNGKEIYEGDIVKASKPNSYLDGEYIVAWHEKKGRWYYSNQPTYKDLYQVGSSGNLWCEVIGNIYETPDLIKN